MKKPAVPKYTTYYIVRHGESEANANGILQGQKDYRLTKRGEEQAVQLAAALRHITFDMVFTSDLLRAKKTAEIIALEHKLIAKTAQALRERNFGYLESKGREDFTPEIHQLFDSWNALSDREWLKHRFVEDGETGEELVSRFLFFLRKIAGKYSGKTILVVSHGDVMRNFLVHLGWATHLELRGTTIANTAYIRIETNGVDFFVKETNGIKKNIGSVYSWHGQERS